MKRLLPDGVKTSLMHAANVIVYLLIGSLIGGEQFRVSREYKREHHRHPLSVPDSKSFFATWTISRVSLRQNNVLGIL